MATVSIEDDLVELTTPADGDLSLIVDISEALDVDKSKSISFATQKKYISLVSEVEKSADYTFALTDAGKIITLTGATGKTFTVPLNATVAFPIGTQIAICKDGIGDVTIAATVGVTIKTEVGLVITEQYAMAALIKVGTNTWRAVGGLNVS